MWSAGTFLGLAPIVDVADEVQAVSRNARRDLIPNEIVETPQTSATSPSFPPERQFLFWFGAEFQPLPSPTPSEDAGYKSHFSVGFPSPGTFKSGLAEISH